MLFNSYIVLLFLASSKCQKKVIFVQRDYQKVKMFNQSKKIYMPSSILLNKD